jgi:hypothetical protein
MTRTTILFRPVGPKELKLIADAGFRGFPPRLAEQPIFYPVLDEGYAHQIARDWNVPTSGAGYVTWFAVRNEFLARYQVRTVGASIHKEFVGASRRVGRAEPKHRWANRDHCRIRRPQFTNSLIH